MPKCNSSCTGPPLLGHTAPRIKRELRFRSPGVVVSATLIKLAIERVAKLLKPVAAIETARCMRARITLTLNLSVSPGEGGAITTLFPRALVPM
jgi:hypothetical protein